VASTPMAPSVVVKPLRPRCGGRQAQAGAAGDLRTAKQWRAGSALQAPGRLKGIADGANSSGARGSQDRAQHGGKHVDVLVGVECA
jgi:hypothetical protein